MNQTTNLIQWKNLTEEQKADFDFKGYKYEKQSAYEWEPLASLFTKACDDRVYRLVIEEDKWYMMGVTDDEPYPRLGSDYEPLEVYGIFRPCKPHEIPKTKEKTLQERIKEELPESLSKLDDVISELSTLIEMVREEAQK